jgi:hypothetical protein
VIGPERTDGLLEARLRDLAAALDVPATPDFAGSVAAHLRARPIRRAGWWHWAPRLRASASPMRRAVLLALIALLLLAAVAVAVAFGLPGLRFALVSQLPSLPGAVATASSPAATASTALSALGDLGPQVPLAQAEGGAGFHVLLPSAGAAGGPPVAHLVAIATGGEQVAVTYAPFAGRPTTLDPAVGLLVVEFAGHLDPALAAKLIGPGTDVSPVVVRGQPGYWITGTPHEFVYLDAAGQVQGTTVRLAGDTLVWADGGVLIRVETGAGLAVAQQIAASMR